MNRIKIYALAACWLSAGLLACSDQLNITPQTSLSDADFWQTEADLKAACNALYTSLPGHNAVDVWSDDAFGTTNNDISDGSRLTPVTSGDWSNNYTLIRRANNIIEKSARAGVTDAIRNRYIGEARFFRAYAYFELLYRFGDVQLITKTLDIDSPELYGGRAKREEIVALIYDDLDFAASALPGAAALGSGGYGRVSKGAALAFKSRVALYEGTRQRYHNYGDAKTNLTVALTAAQTVMAEGFYDLYKAKGADSYYALFQNDGEGFGNKENILVRLFGQNQLNNIAVHNFGRATIEGGGFNSTKSLVDDYLYKDGLPKEKSPLVKPPVNSTTEFENRDPRLNASVFKAGDAYIPVSRPTFINSLAGGRTGYQNKKYFIGADWTSQQSFVDKIIIRYAEVLLNYAEATYELQGTISDADLDKSINLLRTRAAMPKLTNEFVTKNGLTMLVELRRERRIELAQEGFRYNDIIRWKTAETVLPQPVMGARFFAAEFPGSGAPVLDPGGFVIKQEAAKRRFNPAKDYLWPLPTREIGLNNKLTQNPGW